MAKKQGKYNSDVTNHADVKRKGMQDIKKVTDYGARDAWAQTDNPSCVKSYVGAQGEFARYKHRETK